MTEYYNHFTQITMLLRERHLNHFHPGELARMSKDCFYTGLRAKYRHMVVHLKDHPNSMPLDLLAALMENKQNDSMANARYPPAISSKMNGGTHHADHQWPGHQADKQDRYVNCKMGSYATHQMQLEHKEHGQDCYADREGDGYVICPVQLGSEPQEEASEPKELASDPDINLWMD